MNIILCSISALQNPKESARITIIALAKEMKKLGNNVVIAASGRRVGMPMREIFDDKNIILYRYSSFFSLPRTIAEIQRTEGWKADIIHGFSATPLFVIPLFLSKWHTYCALDIPHAPRIPNTSHLTCIPHVSHTSPAKIFFSLKSYSRSKLGRRGSSLLWLADVVTVPTLAHAQTWKMKKYRLMYSPLDREKFLPLDKKALKKKYGWENKKVIMHYGAVSKNKGVDVLMNAIPILAKKIPNLKFIFLPRYKQITPQQELARRLGVEKLVAFITENVCIEEYVNLADVVVLPYLHLNGTEGNPSCLLEALACKTPVVTTKLPELEELFSQCALMALPDDIPSLVENIELALIKNKGYLDRIEKGFQTAKIFDQRSIAQGFLKMYSGG